MRASAVGLSTRILLFEGDAAPPFDGFPASFDHQFPTKGRPDHNQDLHRPDHGYALQVLGPSTSRRLRELFDHIGELVEAATEHSTSASAAREVVRCGELAIDFRTRRVMRGGEAINVSRLEFALLHALVRRHGVVATRKDLVQEVWGAASRVQPRAVDTHIARLRRKIEKTPTRPSYILTAVALGYRFAPVAEGDVS